MRQQAFHWLHGLLPKIFQTPKNLPADINARETTNTEFDREFNDRLIEEQLTGNTRIEVPEQ